MTVPTQQELAAEMSAFFQRTLERKATDLKRESFQLGMTVVTMQRPYESQVADQREISTSAGDPVPNPDAQGL